MITPDFSKSSAWAFTSGAVSILGFFGVNMEIMTHLIDSISPHILLQTILLIVAITLFYLGMTMKRKELLADDKTPLSVSPAAVLASIAEARRDNSLVKWEYAHHGYGNAPVEEPWDTWLASLAKAMNRTDLYSNNFGDYFYFFDLDTGKAIKIPTEKARRQELVGKTLRPGMVLRLMAY